MREYVVILSPPLGANIVPHSVGFQQLLDSLELRFQINYQDHIFAQFFVKADMSLEKFKNILGVHEFDLRISEREYEEEEP